jgi:prevent-host-death family protein
VDTIAQKQLRNQVGDVLRRVEAGETFTVTVAGRPVAELGPTHRRRWVSGPALAAIWHGPPPRRLDDDLVCLGAGLANPFGR